MRNPARVLSAPYSANNIEVKNYSREPNSENCLDLIFAVSPCEKVIFVSDENYITYEIRQFMLHMPGPGSFQSLGFRSETTRAKTM